MKRSEINKIINETIDYMKGRDFPLPPFAYWGKKDWENAGNEYQEIVDNMLGWDITDFGTGNFEHYGLTVFTFRNGNFHNKEKYPKPYAEKLLLVNDGQILPYHYHWSKMEDIINRGGGDLELTLYNATPADFNDVEGGRSGKPGTFDSTPVTVHIDGCEQTFPAGTTTHVFVSFVYASKTSASGVAPVLEPEPLPTPDIITSGLFLLCA